MSEYEKDHLSMGFIYIRENTLSLDDLIENYTELFEECRSYDAIRATIHMLIEDLYPIVQHDIVFNDVIDKIKYLNNTHIVKEND